MGGTFGITFQKRLLRVLGFVSFIYLVCAMLPSRRCIVWFRNDLRLHDNPVLFSASQRVLNTGCEHLCIYCFDPRQFMTSPYESIKTGAFRAKYLIESVENLKGKLQSIGSDLVVTIGKPEEVIPRFANSGSEIFTHGEVTSEEKYVETAVENALRLVNSKLTLLYGGNMLYHIADLPYATDMSNMPDVFTPFKNKVEQHCRVRDLLPEVTSTTLPRSAHLCDTAANNEAVPGTGIPSLSDLGFDEFSIARATTSLDPRSVISFTGGEDMALHRMEQWMFNEDKLKDYFDIRNGMLGSEYSSKLSPALALGCISARRIFWEVKRYEKTRQISNKSTYWLIWELTCRDFFRCICIKYDRRIFYSSGPMGVKHRWIIDANTILRWKLGKTGWPLVDANMRELAATGWMSNRGRQNVASFLIHDCGIDWRVGADHFESLLLDHDVCSNYANWNAMAGLFGGRINKFNISKQSRDYDPDGSYIRQWLPELRRLPVPFIFEPWKMSADQQSQYNVKIGGTEDCAYPSPLAVSYQYPMPHATSGDGTATRGKSAGKAGYRHKKAVKK
jgi:deoxyribodipyrimidine photo-lyase